MISSRLQTRVRVFSVQVSKSSLLLALALALASFFLLFTAGTCLAGNHRGFDYNPQSGTELESGTREDGFGVGWQYTRPARGFSVKIPFYNNYYLQPLLSFSIDKKDDQTKGHYALGLRALRSLPQRQDLHPYMGVGWGRTKDYDSSKDQYGYEAFLGVEYKEFLLVPALEVGLGGYSKADGSFHAGTTINLSVFYYF